MLKLVGHLPGPPEQVAELFEAVESWPEWMSDVRRVRIVERQPERIIFEFQQRQLGRELLQRMELRRRDLQLLQTQESVAMSWRGAWRFLVPPDGRGTTLSLQVDLELRGLGRWLPEQLVRSAMDQWFRQLLEGARGALDRGLATSSSAVPADLLSVVEVGGGEDVHGLELPCLELHCAGRRVPLRGAAAESERVVLEVWHTAKGFELEFS